jgi:hypothetical protein
MLNEDEEKTFRELLRRWEAGDLSPDKIGIPEVGLPDVNGESLLWQCVDKIGTQDFWLGKTRGGRLVRACLTVAGVCQSVGWANSVATWANSHIVYPIAEDVPVVADHLQKFLSDLDAKLFPPSGKDKFLAFANSANQPHVDLMIPATSGIIPEGIIDRGSPPARLWGGYNNSQFVSRQNAMIHMLNDHIRRQNARNNEFPVWLLGQQGQQG